MREIKFRAFQKPVEGSITDKQMREVMEIRWYEDGGTRCLPEEFEILIPCFPGNGSHAWCSTRSHYVMQFTGLKDKNGVDIFEGDIIRGHLKGGGEATGRVYIKDDQASLWGLWIADGPDEKDFGSWDMRQFGYGIDEFTPHLEIIGNIYENPELLTP